MTPVPDSMATLEADGRSLLTAAEVAVWLDVSASTVTRWAKKGQLSAVALPSGRLRFRAEDIAAVLAGTAVPAARAG